MKDFTLPYFGKLYPSNLAPFYQTEVKIGSSEIEIILNINDDTAAVEYWENIQQLLNTIIVVIHRHKDYFKQVVDTNESVKLYAEHHIEELDADTLQKIIDCNNPNPDQRIALLDSLLLTRININVEDSEEESIVVFDYSISQEETQYLLTCETKLHGEIIAISMES